MEDPRRVHIVYIVDNDASVRRSLLRLMRANRMDARCFASAQQLLDEVTSMQYGCVVLDMTMSTALRVQLKARLKEMKTAIPIIATSVRDDPSVRDEAHEIGAKFFLHKPVDNHALLDAIAWVAETMNGQDDTKSDPSGQPG